MSRGYDSLSISDGYELNSFIRVFTFWTGKSIAEYHMEMELETAEK